MPEITVHYYSNVALVSSSDGTLKKLVPWSNRDKVSACVRRSVIEMADGMVEGPIRLAIKDITANVDLPVARFKKALIISNGRIARVDIKPKTAAKYNSLKNNVLYLRHKVDKENGRAALVGFTNNSVLFTLTWDFEGGFSFDKVTADILRLVNADGLDASRQSFPVINWIYSYTKIHADGDKMNIPGKAEWIIRVGGRGRYKNAVTEAVLEEAVGAKHPGHKFYKYNVRGRMYG